MKTVLGRRAWCIGDALAISLLGLLTWAPGSAFATWTLGEPIVSYFTGPGLETPQTDATAAQMAAGGWNLVWANTVAELDVAQAHGLRAMWTSSQHDDTFITVRNHPALYGYIVADEPSASQFAGFADTVAHLRAMDPNHLPYINLLPTYASDSQLGTSSYAKYVSDFISIVKPSILSYDHYQFQTTTNWLGQKKNVDTPDYFKNLAIISYDAKQAGIPFVNIVQASKWDSSIRIPNGNELTYLYNTSLAYGAAGVTDYVYSCATLPRFSGGMVNNDGTPTTLYDTAKTINPKFVAVANQVRSLVHIGAYHLGDLPPGLGNVDGLPAEASPMRLPGNSPFKLSGLPDTTYVTDTAVKGAVLGLWGKDDLLADATMAFVANLNYSNSLTTTVTGPGNLSIFDYGTDMWIAQNSSSVTLTLEPGGGRLVGLTSVVPEPPAMMLLLTGLVGLACYAWRQNRTRVEM